MAKEQGVGAKKNKIKIKEEDLSSPSVPVILLRWQIGWEEEKEERQKIQPPDGYCTGRKKNECLWS